MQKVGSLNIKVLSSSVIEVRNVLYSRGFRPTLVEEVVSVMAGMLATYGIIEYVPTELSDVILAERIRKENPNVTFYDSLHASTAKRLGMKLLSSEGVYDKLGINFMDLDFI